MTQPEPTDFVEATNFSGLFQLLDMRVGTNDAGTKQVRITVDERLMHHQRGVHGGVIFMLADSVMGMELLSTLPPGTRVGTIEAKTNFLLPVHTGELVAEATIVHQGRSIAVLEATVHNIDNGKRRTVARTLGTFNIALPK